MKKVFLILFAVMSAVSAMATEFITDVLLIGGSATETSNLKSFYESRGWTFINQDLNKGAGGDYIYLLYKSEESDGPNYAFITGFYLSNSFLGEYFTSGDDVYYLAPYDGGEHFESKKGNLNSKTGTSTDNIYLYYTKRVRFTDNTRAVSSITFDSDPTDAIVKNGDTNSGAYNLNAGSNGQIIYMHANRELCQTKALTGNGTVDDPYIIDDLAAWSTFSAFVHNGMKSNCYFELTSDIPSESDIIAGKTSITQCTGTVQFPFKGHLIGNSKTLNVDIKGDFACTAPIAYAADATITNLNVTGKVDASKYHNGGLVGNCAGNDSTVISGCVVSTEIISPHYAGGILGHGGKNNQRIIIRNSIFNGSISGFENFAAGIMGWCDNITPIFKNCLCSGRFNPATGGKYHPIACTYARTNISADVTDTYYRYDICAPTVTGSNHINGAEGIGVSPLPVYGKLELAINAVDGNKYYADNNYAAQLGEYDVTQGIIDNYGGGQDAIIEVEQYFNKDKFYTVCYPFPITNLEKGTVYKLHDVTYKDTLNGTRLVVNVFDVTPDNEYFFETEAGTPYFYLPNETGYVSLKGKIDVIPTKRTDFPLNEIEVSDGWKMRGSYTEIRTDENYGKSFVTAIAKSINGKGEVISITHLFALASERTVEPLQSYLTYTNTNSDLWNNMPATLVVNFVDKKGSIAAVGTINTATGQMTIDSWYDFNGHILENEPTEPGLYIHNNKKIMINR